MSKVLYPAYVCYLFKASVVVFSVLLSFMRVSITNVSMSRAFSCCWTNHCFKCKVFFLIAFQRHYVLGKKREALH